MVEMELQSAEASGENPTSTPSMSKNQLKKLKRDQAWAEGHERRKARRKEKIREKKLRNRAHKEAFSNITSEHQPPADVDQVSAMNKKRNPNHHQFVQLPITLVLDCGFDDLMPEKELKSLASQVTRCYSDNHRAPYQAHLAICSFGGHLKERFEGVLESNHQSWKNVRFLQGDFVEAAEQAQEWMRGDEGGTFQGVFEGLDNSESTSSDKFEAGEVVYLTSDSPDTLTELRPYGTYIIGGLVDRNRHKRICYKRAMDRGMRTAKLPIGEYMQMASRFVLATNHVSEIMLRWLELGDWGKAFLQVVPKRKGGVLKASLESHDDNESMISTETTKFDERAAGVAKACEEAEQGSVATAESQEVGGKSTHDDSGVNPTPYSTGSNPT